MSGAVSAAITGGAIRRPRPDDRPAVATADRHLAAQHRWTRGCRRVGRGARVPRVHAVGPGSVAGHEGHWSPAALHHADPVAVPVEAAATLALAAVTVHVAAVALRRSRALLDAHRLAAALPAHGADLTVIADPVPCAYAVPGRPGRIVASVGLLRGLDAGQRRAVLAHDAPICGTTTTPTTPPCGWRPRPTRCCGRYRPR